MLEFENRLKGYWIKETNYPRSKKKEPIDINRDCLISNQTEIDRNSKREKKYSSKYKYVLYILYENKFDAVYSMQIILENFGNILKDNLC